MKNKNLILAATLLLAACATQQQTGAAGLKPRPASNYQPQAPMARQYGDWWLEPTTCTIRATAEDFTLQTNGNPQGNTITIRMISMWPLADIPSAEVTGLSQPVPVEGGNRHYSIMLPYTPTSAAEMLKGGTYLVVQYQTLAGPQKLQSSFDTHGLMEALANLSLYCR